MGGNYSREPCLRLRAGPASHREHGLVSDSSPTYDDSLSRIPPIPTDGFRRDHFAQVISLRSSSEIRGENRNGAESVLSHAVEPARGLLVTGTGGKNK